MIWRSVPLVSVLGCWLACAAAATTVTFDFDTGTPPLFAGQNLPMDQVSGGVTAHFSSPTVGAGGFSVQSDATTQFHLSQFSGNYLYPNSVYNPALDIQFDQPVTSITFTFATADFQQVEIPTTIELTAYENATGAPSIGVATAQGTYGGDTMPMGMLAFVSTTPFNLVEITIPYAPLAASGFLVDNITVTTTSVPPTVTLTPTPAPTPGSPQCVGDCNSDGQVVVNELIEMVNIALGNAAGSTCTPGGDGEITVNEIVAGVNNALNGCPTASAATAVTVQLQPIPDAFARLGHSCGGIKQQAFGEGFDANGNVIGYVFASTRCGGSGKGGGYRTTTYSTWVAVTWNLSGVVIGEVASVPNPDPSIAGAYHSGSVVGGANYPTCNNITPYDNAFTCFSVPVGDITGTYWVQTSLYVVNQAACTASNTSYCSYRALLTMAVTA